ncbi:AMP-binding enzyme family protein [Dirofilaria immitis]|nr:AMP-binding enzyme family protein [Dirofilaria immitis]
MCLDMMEQSVEIEKNVKIVRFIRYPFANNNHFQQSTAFADSRSPDNRWTFDRYTQQRSRKMQKSKRMIQKLQNFPPLSLQGDLSNEDSDTRNNVSFVVQNASPIKLPKIDGVETATEEIGAKYVKLDQAWYCTEFDDYIGGVWNCELINVEKLLTDNDGKHNQDLRCNRKKLGLEESLLDIWKEVLGSDEITIFDNFFVRGDDLLKLRHSLNLIIMRRSSLRATFYCQNNNFYREIHSGTENYIARWKITPKRTSLTVTNPFHTIFAVSTMISGTN